jgi:hypothetical protein
MSSDSLLRMCCLVRFGQNGSQGKSCLVAHVRGVSAESGPSENARIDVRRVITDHLPHVVRLPLRSGRSAGRSVRFGRGSQDWQS